MTIEMRNDGSIDQFPVGMRVLAVDDDPICLKLLETLLRKCQYHVTTRDRAIKALEVLRENKDKFDLVISDVHMPDMDGFKLLELVGLEMDLPVIMLSANGDPKMVMKGITHGACDYLLKPVRLEELKNIWQHVIRKKKVDKKGQSDSDKREKRSCPADEGRKCSAVGDSEQDGRNCKRRKDQSEDDDDEETDENGHEDDDPSSQKKARVVWSVELHRKFVAAVNQLGFDRAMPKKILDLMNVEKLTRENVASHLQKYRLYLKRLSSVANQQANMVAALGSADSAYLRMNPMNFHNFNGSGPFQNNALRSFPPAGMLGRLNSPSGLSIHGLSPSGIAPLGHPQMTQSPITDSSKFQLPRDHQTGNILQGMPTSLEFDQLQIPLNKSVIGVAGEFSSTNERSGRFSVSGGMLDGKNAVNGPGSNPVVTLPNNPLLLQDHSQEIRRQGSLGNQASVVPVQLRPDSGFGVMGSNRINGNWPSSVPSSGVQSTSYGSNAGYPQPPLVQAYNPGNSVSSSALNGASELHIPSNLPRFDTRCQGAVLCNDGAQNMGYSPIHHPDYTNSSMNPSMVSQGACSSAPVGHYSGSNDLGFTGHPSMVYGMDPTTNLGAFAVDGAGSLEDVVTSMNNWEQDGATVVNKSSDLGSYPLRTCI